MAQFLAKRFKSSLLLTPFDLGALGFQACGDCALFNGRALLVAGEAQGAGRQVGEEERALVLDSRLLVLGVRQECIVQDFMALLLEMAIRARRGAAEMTRIGRRWCGVFLDKSRVSDAVLARNVLVEFVAFVKRVWTERALKVTRGAGLRRFAHRDADTMQPGFDRVVGQVDIVLFDIVIAKRAKRLGPDSVQITYATKEAQAFSFFNELLVVHIKVAHGHVTAGQRRLGRGARPKRARVVIGMESKTRQLNKELRLK